ncbi:hypothetical protein [Actinomadura violacea]|uniref:Secreted protein n=1 Tax=Actinomadura violacea TaxID=2819934 RepID=A0ABS3RLN3_9ACTN|nr:hypothetical protein [Actinomadura violacea]MBO2457601.1 hypothetical protein [Actinomadura violacea]
MKRSTVWLLTGLGLTLCVPLVAIGMISHLETTNCAHTKRQVKAARNAVASETAELRAGPFKVIAICDSGDPAYASAALNSSTPPEEAVRRLEKRGWKSAGSEQANGHVISRLPKKKLADGRITLWIGSATAQAPASIGFRVD